MKKKPQVISAISNISKQRHVFYHFLKFLKPYWVHESVVFVLMILGTVSSLAFPYIMKIIIDDVFPNKDYELLIFILLLLLGITVGNIIISFCSNYLFTWIKNRVMMDIRSHLFDHLIQLPLSFYDRNKSGDIVYRMSNEVDRIQSFITSSALSLVHSLLTLLGLTVALCWLNWQLFLVSIIVIPFLALNIRYFQPKIRDITERGRKKGSEVMSYLIERFETVQLIQVYNAYNYENNRLCSQLNDLLNINMQNVTYSGAMRSISRFLTSLTPAIILGWGGHKVMLGVMSLGALVAFLQYLSRLFAPFRNLNRLYIALIRVSVSMKRVFEFLEIDVQKNIDGSAASPFSFKKEIAFTNLNFGYNGQPVLQDFSLRLEKGKKYALVGSSGCGKSSLVNVLCRFYESETGAITIDHTPITNIKLYELREHIGLVTQENQVFHDTIWNNIRYSKLESTPEEINRAIILTGLNGFIEKAEDGALTLIGDRGNTLSAGQRQRIAIARAILKDSDILILDEATSALDSESEGEIITNLQDLYEDKTLIVISHRLSTIQQVDEVICLDEGRIMERGPHEELLEKKGHYWRLFRKQLIA
ncbi:ABC transporter ATP-binding protein [Candidatus Poribacteria bacterium]|nr:ABC transporter ATP-binding protein [Candidatus Poribacteria bacterium]